MVRLQRGVASYRATPIPRVSSRRDTKEVAWRDRAEKSQDDMSALTYSTGVWRFVFWLAYVLGTLMLALSWLLAQVPRSSHGDMRLEYTIRFGVAALMTTAIVIARRRWKINLVIPDRGAASTLEVVILIAWCELIVAVLGIIAIAVSKH
jgi:hypothetical protein